MATDQVTTIFGADDSAFQAAARRVKQALGGVEAATATATAGVKGLQSAFTGLLTMVGAIAGVATVFETFRKSIAQAAERETAQQQLEAVAGSAKAAAGAVEKLEEISRETGTDFPELAQGTKRLMEAGLSADEAADATERLEKIALDTGSSFEELGDIYARIMTKQEVSAKDLAKLAAAGVPGIAAISKEFKGLERSTQDADRALQVETEQLNRNFEQTEKNISGLNAFIQKTGLLQQAFRAFQQHENIGRLFVDGIGADLGEQIGTQFTEGLKQISRETGISENNLQELTRTGKLGFEDLIQAAQRFREEQHKQQEQTLQTKHFEQQTALLEKQRGLLAQVGEAITQATSKGGIFENVNTFLSTFAGKWREIQHDIDETFEAFGTPLINAFKPVLDALHGQLAPTLQDIATKFGNWLSGEVTTFFNAFESGDWSKIADEANQAFKTVLKSIGQGIQSLATPFAAMLTSPQVNSALTNLTKTFANTLAASIEGAVIAGWDAGLKDEADKIKAALNPFSKEFWMGGFGGTPVQPGQTTPATIPVPQVESTSPMSDIESMNTLGDILDQMTALNGNLKSVLSTG